MGSFNTSCAVTHQTIAPYDKCRVMVIMQSASYHPAKLSYDGKEQEAYGIANSSCNADCFWVPVTGFLPAKYDDYGRFELLLEPVARFRLTYFFLDLLKTSPTVEVGENASHDLDFDLDAFMQQNAPKLYALGQSGSSLNGPSRGSKLALSEMAEVDAELTACWGYMAERMHKHRLFRRDYGGRMRPLQIAVLHEEAYRALVTHMAASKDWDGQSREQSVYLQRALATAVSETDRFIREYGDSENNVLSRTWRMSDVLREAMRRACGGTHASLNAESALQQCWIGQIIAGTLSEADFIDKMTSLLNDSYALACMSDWSLPLSPMVYAGQDYDNEVGRAYAALTAAVSRKVTEARKVSCYGEPLAYEVRVTSPLVGTELDTFGPEADTYFNVQDIVPQEPGHYLLKFECPLELEDTLEVLQNFLGEEDKRILLDSLKAL